MLRIQQPEGDTAKRGKKYAGRSWKMERKKERKKERKQRIRRKQVPKHHGTIWWW